MSEKITISIALCTYNGARYLQEQLDSFANQTRLPDEVVVGDDGSTDATLEILEAWAETVPFPVRIQKNETTLKPTKNFEATMFRCTGDVVFLSDQDDVWLPEKIAKMAQVFESEPQVSLLFCEGDIVDANGKPLSVTQGQIGFPASMQAGRFLFSPDYFSCKNVAGCCSAFRCRFLEFLHPERFEITHHDHFLLNMLSALGEVRWMPENLIHYRVHGQNVSVCADWRKAHRKALAEARTVYRRIVGIYFFHEKELDEYIHEMTTFPESRYKSKALRYLNGNRIHYQNRDRIQRNFFVFFPLFILELISGRYFERWRAFRSLLYDMGMGIFHGLNPVGTLKLCRDISVKSLRKRVRSSAESERKP